MELLADIVSNVFSEEAEASYSVISSSAYQYSVGNMLGQGSFGKVVKCLNLQTQIPVAVKIQKDEFTKRELEMMSKIQHLDPDEYNMIRCYESFQCGEHSCLVFELLDKTLQDLMEERGRLSPSEIRPIMQQMFVALDGLRSIGVVHADINLNNIMLVNHKEQPFRVKLIDFGFAALASNVEVGMPDAGAIDMLALGMVISSMLIGPLLYEDECDYYMLRLFVDSLRQLSADLSDAKTFFKHGNAWRLRIRKERFTSGEEKETSVFRILNEAVNYYETSNWMEYVDFCEFMDLLQKMIAQDPKERITPTEALKHNFITRRHVVEASQYTERCFQLMQACERDQRADSKHGRVVSEADSAALDDSGLDRTPASASASGPSKTCLISYKGSVKSPTDCEVAVGGDPSTDGVVVHDRWDVRNAVDDDSRVQGHLPPETTDGGQIEPWKRIQRFFSNVFNKLSQVYKKVQRVFCSVVRATFCRDGHPPNDDDTAVVTGNSTEPSGSNPRAPGLGSPSGVTTDFATPSARRGADVKASGKKATYLISKMLRAVSQFFFKIPSVPKTHHH